MFTAMHYTTQAREFLNMQKLMVKNGWMVEKIYQKSET